MFFRNPPTKGNETRPRSVPGDPLASPTLERANGAEGTTSSVRVPVRMRSERSAPQIVEPEAVASSLEAAFSKERTDPEWSTRHRELVRETVDALIDRGVGSGSIEELSCRSQHCQLVLESLGGPEDPQLMRLVDALQDERGFLGKAQGIMLSRNEDGIRMTLRFPPATP